MHISQPAITKQIKNLEDNLNCKLFIRNQKGVILTNAGELIFQDIKNGLNSFEIARRKISDNNEILTGVIKIGISATLAKTYLLAYIEEFHHEYPNVTFEISTDPTSILKTKLKKGSIDFIIAKFPPKTNDGFKYTKIGTTEDIFIANSNFQELANQKIYFKDLIKYPILIQKQPSSSRDHFESFCRKNNFKFHSVMEISSSNLLIEFTKIGYGVGVVTKEYVLNDLKNKTIFEVDVYPKMPKRNFGIITLQDNYLSKVSDKFLTLLKK